MRVPLCYKRSASIPGTGRGSIRAYLATKSGGENGGDWISEYVEYMISEDYDALPGALAKGSGQVLRSPQLLRLIPIVAEQGRLPGSWLSRGAP